MFGAFARRMGASERTIGRFLIVALALGFTSLVVAGIASAWITGNGQRHAAAVNHTYQVELAIARLRGVMEQGEATRRGYLIVPQPVYLQRYLAVSRQVAPAIDVVGRLSSDNPRQRANIGRYKQLAREVIGVRERTLSLANAGRTAEAVSLFADEAQSWRMRDLRELADQMTAEEERLLAIRDGEQRRTLRVFYAVLSGTGLLLLLVALATLATVRGYTRDLSTSRDRLHQLNETLEDQVDERTADLTRANEEIQRFAYIVSHDLRSPLVNVMGFTAELDAATGALRDLVDRAEAEAPALLTDDAKTAAHEDLPEAIGFIRSSTAKMDRLINAILKLSRQGRRVIVPEAFDPAELADGAVASLKQIADARSAVIEVRRPMPRLVSDKLAVEQILSNLIENATKYLDPARAGQIVISGAAERGRVVLSVADNGRGIAPADHQRVFDLFRRSGTQDQPGEGIGLAHVRALAYRLGGTIDLTSALGQGSTFRLVLPPVIQPEARS